MVHKFTEIIVDVEPNLTSKIGIFLQNVIVAISEATFYSLRNGIQKLKD